MQSYHDVNSSEGVEAEFDLVGRAVAGIRTMLWVWDVVVDVVFFFSSRRRHTRFDCDWSSDVCSSDLRGGARAGFEIIAGGGSAERHIQMRVSVDAAGKQQHSGSVDDAAGGLGGKRKTEKRRVGEEGRSRWAPEHLKKKKKTVS